MSFGQIVLWLMVLGPVAYWILGKPDFGEAVMSAFPFFIGAVMLVVGKLSKASDKQLQDLCKRENLTITARVGYTIMVDEKARKLTFPPYQRAYDFSDIRHAELTWETKPSGVLPMQSSTTWTIALTMNDMRNPLRKFTFPLQGQAETAFAQLRLLMA